MKPFLLNCIYKAVSSQSHLKDISSFTGNATALLEYELLQLRLEMPVSNYYLVKQNKITEQGSKVEYI